MSKPRRTGGRCWIFFATIRGHGKFPVDMLRHDSCYPRTEADAATIERTFETHHNHWTVRVVRLAATATHFTDARWESFGVTLEETDE